MNKTEAITALKQGKRLTHRHFTPEEWVERHPSGKLVFEDGCQCSMTEFWQYRTCENFNKDWAVMQSSKGK